MCTIQPCTSLQCHFIQSHIGRVYVCLAVTCHLHFWQNDRDLLHAAAVTRGWNGYRNKSQHRKLTLEKKILLRRYYCREMSLQSLRCQAQTSFGGSVEVGGGEVLGPRAVVVANGVAHFQEILFLLHWCCLGERASLQDLWTVAICRLKQRNCIPVTVPKKIQL